MGVYHHSRLVSHEGHPLTLNLAWSPALPVPLECGERCPDQLHSILVARPHAIGPQSQVSLAERGGSGDTLEPQTQDRPMMRVTAEGTKPGSTEQDVNTVLMGCGDPSLLAY
jgi:hypothetical protein